MSKKQNEGQRFQEWIAENRYSQKEIADKMGVSVMTLQRWFQDSSFNARQKAQILSAGIDIWNVDSSTHTVNSPTLTNKQIIGSGGQTPQTARELELCRQTVSILQEQVNFLKDQVVFYKDALEKSKKR